MRQWVACWRNASLVVSSHLYLRSGILWRRFSDVRREWTTTLARAFLPTQDVHRTVDGYLFPMSGREPSLAAEYGAPRWYLDVTEGWMCRGLAAYSVPAEAA